MTFTPEAPFTYFYICSLLGHMSGHGMWGRFVVEYRSGRSGLQRASSRLRSMQVSDDPASANGALRAFMVQMDEQAMVVTGPQERLEVPLPFEEFFENERPRLFRALLLVTHDSAEAEDLMQEAFVRMWERWNRVAQIEDPVGYLFRTAMNLHRSALRHALTAAKRSLRPPAGRDPFDEVAARDEAVRSLAMLTPRQRAAVVVTELLGYSSEEAGAILGVRSGTVRTLTSQARAALLAWKEPDDD